MGGDQVTGVGTYFDLQDWPHTALFQGVTHVWEALDRLADYVEQLVPRRDIQGIVMEGAFLQGNVFVAEGAVIEPGAMVMGPVWIGPGTVIRHTAYVRGPCLFGARCCIGHATEVKGSIFLDGAHAPHLNYVGDSILGRRVNIGAGVKLSNLKNDGTEVVVAGPDGQKWPSGRRKLGAIVGDGVQIGCNAVASPGTLIGRDTLVYPNAVIRGVVPPGSIVKLRQQLETVERREA